MIQSMTGYSRVVLQLPEKKITLEVKSLNSRNLDIDIKIPLYYKEREMEIRKYIAQKLLRGKVEFSIYIEHVSEAAEVGINKKIVQKYIEDLQGLDTEKPISTKDVLPVAMNLPNVLTAEEKDLEPKEWKQISMAIGRVLEQMVAYRTREAIALEKDIKKRIETIKKLSEEIEILDKERVEDVRLRLQKSIKELKVKVDKNRFEQELIFYLERLDINEERVRLRNHLFFFLETLENNASQGKKLGFIAQEMGREINTIGSKANFAKIQKVAVQMKVALEKIKEQLLNIL